MKTITMKKTILNRVALFASLVSVIGAYANTHNETLATDCGAFFYSFERNLSTLCDPNSKTSINTILVDIRKMLDNFKPKVEPLRNGGTSISAKLCSLSDYIVSEAIRFCAILDKYNGKSSSQTLYFVADIQNGFNTEKIFAEVSKRLRDLRCEAIQAKEDCLVKKIETLITMLERKKKEWNAKNKATLFAGLKVRMDCK